jgi:hypothetical protein
MPEGGFRCVVPALLRFHNAAKIVECGLAGVDYECRGNPAGRFRQAPAPDEPLNRCEFVGLWILLR